MALLRIGNFSAQRYTSFSLSRARTRRSRKRRRGGKEGGGEERAGHFATAAPAGRATESSAVSLSIGADAVPRWAREGGITTGIQRLHHTLEDLNTDTNAWRNVNALSPERQRLLLSFIQQSNRYVRACMRAGACACLGTCVHLCMCGSGTHFVRDGVMYLTHIMGDLVVCLGVYGRVYL